MAGRTIRQRKNLAKDFRRKGEILFIEGLISANDLGTIRKMSTKAFNAASKSRN